VVNSQAFAMEKEDLAAFNRDLPWKTITDRQVLGKYMSEKVLRNLVWVTLFPVYVQGRLYALLAVAWNSELAHMESPLKLMRQIADHLAVAWSNVNLIRDLRRLTMGSMQALARAVDAKSSWTAGHSARVMRIALSIARCMELDKDRIDRLQQAALLHDIGKIGIRAAILDKPGKLTDEEFAIIRQHPVIGDNILSPIEAFRDIIPIVRQHHERWDGNGYPDGLAGEAISLEARILTVADVYDAMASDRPYRSGMALSKVLSTIESESGHQFDPAVVVVFLEMMQEKAELAA
jgi:putative nucleotidyltransferase with HDIG domain